MVTALGIFEIKIGEGHWDVKLINKFLISFNKFPISFNKFLISFNKFPISFNKFPVSFNKFLISFNSAQKMAETHRQTHTHTHRQISPLYSSEINLFLT